MAPKPKDILDTVTSAGRSAVSEVAGIARRFRRDEDDAPVTAAPTTPATLSLIHI